ncbi:RagB/SusD family nutrient uptake outer membrane protein [Paradesertivirga mongoliensis]|uniref:RagB/SusD family nutrient uptake outer membrane protein n=1 Tax=Paradesertivirga mongoliensis TaxID=2100740 RepID=A0ABW4ZKU1_9SPHI|nr:RagB/SusD family nutrient uptake outer membrane protein [Pedobacter mongoliensis]
MNRISILVIGVLFTLSGCEKFIEPAPVNNGEYEDIYTQPTLAHGILLNGYTRLPSAGWTFDDVATDDAVSNDINNGFRRAATGQWSAIDNPFDRWHNARAGIQYLNLFLAEAEKVTWDTKSPMVATMFKDRYMGEAYGLRAYMMFYLLQAHAGWSNGVLYGVPLILEPENPFSDFNKPRATFEDCMKQIYSDLDKAEALLPLDYKQSAISDVPAKYAGVSAETYNRVFGEQFKQLMTRRIAKAIRAKASLLAASPAYSTGNTTTWTMAANHAADVLNANQWLFDTKGHIWYEKDQVDGLGSGGTPPEVLWRTNIGTNSNLEADHYPPSLQGRGRLNPTQNLVDAFPMANGYPIDNTALSGYNPAAPYTGRDPRLARTVIFNRGTAGPSNTEIFTSVDYTNTATPDRERDGLNKTEQSTRTGYYMKKLLRQDVSIAGTVNNQKHYKPHIRYTELFLIYAEAANEAFGPLGTGGHAHSAYDIVKMIRNRAGITGGDAYLESIKANKDLMRDLIRNERRLELAFEGFRFWDIRRWNQSMNDAAKGMRISQNNSIYQVIDVEARPYEDFMRFGPVPYSEILKYNALQQNTGW